LKTKRVIHNTPTLTKALGFGQTFRVQDEEAKLKWPMITCFQTLHRFETQNWLQIKEAHSNKL